jgi:hypothetical protein
MLHVVSDVLGNREQFYGHNSYQEVDFLISS